MIPMLNINQAKFTRIEDMAGLEVFKANYTTHAFSRHWHEEFGIGVVESGCEVFDYQGEKFHALPRNVILMNPGVVHTGQAANQEVGWHYRIMYPNIKLVQEVVEQFCGNHSVLPHFSTPVIVDTEIADKLLFLFKVLEEPTSLLERDSVFFLTMAGIIQKHATLVHFNKKWACDHIVAEHVRDYIDNNFDKNISLAELSMVAGKSQFHLLRIFQRTFGIPPHSYQILSRIQRSKVLLLEGKPISLIASELGFADQSHFTRHFKRIVGITPRGY